jgi:uncharacterized protein YfiM (DUF2279 family)
MARIGSLLGDLPGEAGNGGEMYAWGDPGDADSMREHVCGLIAGAMRSCCPGLPPAGTGGHLGDAAHMPSLAEVDEAAATALLTWLLSTGLVYADQGRYPKSKAQDISTTLARLLGSGARWWTSTRPQGSGWSWSPPSLRRTTRSMPLSLA